MLTGEQVKMIRCTVSGALAGLVPESVSVIDLNGRAYPGGPAGNSPDASDDPYLSRKTQYEQQFTESITNMLSFVKRGRDGKRRIAPGNRRCRKHNTHRSESGADRRFREQPVAKFQLGAHGWTAGIRRSGWG